VKSSRRVFAREYVEIGIPFFRSKDVIDKSLGVFSDYDLYISKERFDELHALTGSPKDGDLLLSSVGNRSGIPYVVNGDGDFYFKDGNIIWISEFDELDSNFLYYFFKSKVGQATLQSVMIGSAQKALTIDAIRSLKIEVSNLTTQKATAHILGTLDDKIELNQKMNQTLEEIAKAIFKSWFVDFDPVRAKAEGRPTGLPPEISDLFPDELVDSEIGEIPKRWDINTLGEHTVLTKGRSYRSAELMESDTALVTLKSFLRGGGYRLDGLKPYTGTFKPEQVVEEGDLIIALTDVTQAADVIGKPAIVRSSSEHSQLVASLDVGVVRLAENSFLTKEFCYFLMLSYRYTHHSLGYTSGTTVLHLAKDALAKFEICLPPTELVEQFTNLASTLMQRIFVSEKESEMLSELRDTLLPKLISGELRIPDAEKFLEEAGI
tara:strand:+ start:378 stop:1682 length:1305 start_codon:yes stop_codon:yes gene_type:complete